MCKQNKATICLFLGLHLDQEAMERGVVDRGGGGGAKYSVKYSKNYKDRILGL